MIKGSFQFDTELYSNDLKAVIKLMLKVKSSNRPSAKKLLENKIVLDKMKELALNSNNRLYNLNKR